MIPVQLVGQGGRVKRRSQLLGFDSIWNVFDRRNLGNTLKDALLQLRVQVRVRITLGVWNRPPLAAGLGWLSCRSQKVPFSDDEPDDLDAALEMFPLTRDFAAAVFVFSIKSLVGDCSAKLIR